MSSNSAVFNCKDCAQEVKPSTKKRKLQCNTCACLALEERYEKMISRKRKNRSPSETKLNEMKFKIAKFNNEKSSKDVVFSSDNCPDASDHYFSDSNILPIPYLKIPKSVGSDRFSKYIKLISPPISRPKVKSNKISIRKNFNGSAHFYPNVSFDMGLDRTKLETKEDKARLVYLVNRRRDRIIADLTAIYGSPLAVKVNTDGDQTRINYPCPVKNCPYKGRDLKRHLCAESKYNHKWKPRQATLMQSFSSKMFNYITKVDRSNGTKPLICKDCNTVQGRLDNHLKRSHNQKGIELSESLQECKKYTSHLYKLIRNDSCLSTQETEPSACDDSIEHEEHEEITTRERKEPTSTITTKLAQVKESKNHQKLPLPKNNNIKAKPTKLRGKLAKITPSKLMRYAVLTKNIPITQEFETKYNLQGNFKHTYETADDVLNDFVNYRVTVSKNKLSQAIQYAANVKQLWKSVDTTLSLNPNHLKNVDDIEDWWLSPRIEELEIELAKPFAEQDNADVLQASTLRAKLQSLKKFIKFLQLRKIFVGLKLQDFIDISLKMSEMGVRLNAPQNERKNQVREFKSCNLLTSDDIARYFKSDHVKKTVKLLDRLLNEEEVEISYYQACHARNYLSIVLTTVNALRASNLINMTLADLDAHQTHENFTFAKCIKSKKYKTSLLYGTKIILVANHVFDQLEVFVKKIRPVLIKDENLPQSQRHLFVTKTKEDDITAQKMSHSTISSMMTSEFEKAKVLFRFFCLVKEK